MFLKEMKITDRIDNISRHVREVTQSPEAWLNFLDTVSRFPEFSFYEVLAIHSKKTGAEKLRIVCLYYFSGKSDQEISDICKIPRSTVQYQRSSAFEMLKKDLEEQTDEQ